MKDILVIDDDQDILNFLDKILSTAGYGPILSSTVEDGLKKLKSLSPHLILLDLQLGQTTGLELLQEIKQNPVLNSIPVIMMSGNVKKKVVYESIALGAKDFMPKPLIPNVLLQKIKKTLKEHELPTYKFKNKEAATAEIHGELIKISEVGCILESTVKLSGPVEILLDSKYLKSLGLNTEEMKIFGEGILSSPGHYSVELTFLGINEKTAQKIRQIKAT